MIRVSFCAKEGAGGTTDTRRREGNGRASRPGQTRGLRGKWGWPKAALVSAGLFAVAHVIPTSILPIFILGLIFAFLYQASGSIWPAILMHMLTNTVALLVAYATSQGWLSLP